LVATGVTAGSATVMGSANCGCGSGAGGGSGSGGCCIAGAGGSTVAAGGSPAGSSVCFRGMSSSS
jgi:hypothetical protein